MSALPAFTLDDLHGRTHAFPAARPALLCFVKEDCPTCGITLPLIEATHRAYGERVAVWAIGQDNDHSLIVARHQLTLPMLDDSALRVSFLYEVEIVPTIILADANGNELQRCYGFRQTDWVELFARLSQLTRLPTPHVDWASYPEWRPGCGSKSVEPEIAERLQAEADVGAKHASPLRARRIEIAPSDDEFEFMFDQGLTDGLPVVPPTAERVLRMLQGTRRDAQAVVAVVPPNLAPATVEKVAVNAVMAGCRPEYLPVVIAALEATCTDEFNIHGVLATTWGATPCLVVNGPIRQRIGMNSGVNALGQGNRANATIGRAVKLVLRNVGGAKPAGIERSTLGSPAKFTLCFAEWEEISPWQPLHVERGFDKDESVVTVFALEAPHGIADQVARTGRALAGSFGLGLESVWHPKYHNFGDALLVVCPEHARTLAQDGWTKDDVRRRIQEVTMRPLRDLLPDEETGHAINVSHSNFSGEQLNQRMPKFKSLDNIHIVVAGGDAGKFSAILGGWVSGAGGSVPVSRQIEV